MDLSSDSFQCFHRGVRQLFLIPDQARQVAHLTATTHVRQRTDDFGFRDYQIVAAQPAFIFKFRRIRLHDLLIC